jgi:excinuclease UvrABC helicase subunit UvrB
LPFNQIAAEVVAEVTLSNKQITNNSRVAANLLENGKEIFRNKKLEYFNSFKEEYKLIGEAL